MRGTGLGKPLGATSLSASQACEPVKAATILDQLSLIEQILSDTGNLLNILNNKVSPVLRPSSPSPSEDNGNCEKVCSNGEVIRQLLNITESLNVYNNVIEDIINRLEIA